MVKQNVHRCGWVSSDPEYQRYHDEEWGRPVTNSQQLFAKLCLDGQQAGLSWITILKKQQNFEQAFYQFDPTKIVTMTDDDVETLMQNPGIIRNRLKIQSIIRNANGFLKIEEKESFIMSCSAVRQQPPGPPGPMRPQQPTARLPTQPLARY